MEKTKKVSAEQRAEKIADLAEHVLFSDIPDDSFTAQAVDGRRLLLQTIASTIEQAEREAYKAGAEAMRELAAKEAIEFSDSRWDRNVRLAERIRAISLPSDTTPGDCICAPLSQPRTDCPFHGKAGKE